LSPASVDVIVLWPVTMPSAIRRWLLHSLVVTKCKQNVPNPLESGRTYNYFVLYLSAIALA